MRFLVTGRMREDGAEELPSSIKHLAPVQQFEATDEESAREEVARIYPGQAIYYLRLWKAVEVV